MPASLRFSFLILKFPLRYLKNPLVKRSEMQNISRVRINVFLWDVFKWKTYSGNMRSQLKSWGLTVLLPVVNILWYFWETIRPKYSNIFYSQNFQNKHEKCLKTEYETRWNILWISSVIKKIDATWRIFSKKFFHGLLEKN